MKKFPVRNSPELLFFASGRGEGINFVIVPYSWYRRKDGHWESVVARTANPKPV